MDNNFDLYNEILAAGPSPGTLFLVLSKMKEEGEHKRVIQECIKALMVYPSDILLRKLLAETYLEDGQASMAEDEFLKVACYLHDLAPVYKSQARIYLKQKRDEDAKKALKLYLAHCPNDSETLDLLSSLSPPDQRKEPESIDIDREAEPAFEFARRIPGSGEDRLPDIATPTLAEIYFKQGQLQDAKDMYEKIVRENPDDEKPRQRLEELKSLLAATPAEEEAWTEPPGDRESEKPALEKVLFEPEGLPEELVFEDPVRIKTEKMISVLEKWLGDIRESANII